MLLTHTDQPPLKPDDDWSYSRYWSFAQVSEQIEQDEGPAATEMLAARQALEQPEQDEGRHSRRARSARTRRNEVAAREEEEKILGPSGLWSGVVVFEMDDDDYIVSETDEDEDEDEDEDGDDDEDRKNAWWWKRRGMRPNQVRKWRRGHHKSAVARGDMGERDDDVFEDEEEGDEEFDWDEFYVSEQEDGE